MLLMLHHRTELRPMPLLLLLLLIWLRPETEMLYLHHRPELRPTPLTLMLRLRQNWQMLLLL
jgi:hypothetical protein